MECEICGEIFNDALGRYGCPNCFAKGIDVRATVRRGQITIWSVFVIFYLGMSFFTYSATFAYMQGNSARFLNPESECRHDMGIAAISGLVPPWWILAPFFTGFFEHGFKIRCTQPESTEEGQL